MYCDANLPDEALARLARALPEGKLWLEPTSVAKCFKVSKASILSRCFVVKPNAGEVLAMADALAAEPLSAERDAARGALVEKILRAAGAELRVTREVAGALATVATFAPRVLLTLGAGGVLVVERRGGAGAAGANRDLHLQGKGNQGAPRSNDHLGAGLSPASSLASSGPITAYVVTHVPAVPPAGPIVNVTGCGDCFFAAVMAAHLGTHGDSAPATLVPAVIAAVKVASAKLLGNSAVPTAAIRAKL